jgi:hypothetical protein
MATNAWDRKGLVGTRNGGYLILAQRPVVEGNVISLFLDVVLGWNADKQEFVTWIANHQDSGYCDGHYICDQKAALKDFATR